jgi:3-deoxy-7-phosphoheptulonate synthase
MAWHIVANRVNSIVNRSHEGLMLDWEQAMTREADIAGSGPSPKEKAFYNTSAHFLWIGDRTRQLDGAHIEYFRGIRNPIGIKVGPSLENAELIRLLHSMHNSGHSSRRTYLSHASS